jgi:preprotein translocase subunit SecE
VLTWPSRVALLGATLFIVVLLLTIAVERVLT